MCRIDDAEGYVDGGHLNARNDVNVLEVTRVEIEECIDPYGGAVLVRNGEGRTLPVVRGLRVDEVRIPVATSPGALAFGAKERGSTRVSLRDGEVETVDDVGRRG